ncbi:Hypothetical predicted protein [Olea europaea subsp. europaea]|uniref:Uncharacterized protein n=1 Tax=Olea europaea subsp. europaea TaxID=158383 RepID=A0A8S0P7W9_OLEEU|nr:Hypothetical predicted protein [Olea europaea subsp. europaea]
MAMKGQWSSVNEDDEESDNEKYSGGDGGNESAKDIIEDHICVVYEDTPVNAYPIFDRDAFSTPRVVVDSSHVHIPSFPNNNIHLLISYTDSVDGSPSNVGEKVDKQCSEIKKYIDLKYGIERRFNEMETSLSGNGQPFKLYAQTVTGTIH